MNTDKKSNLDSVEILAPAGSFQAMKAAFHAGADAVYAGGAHFGARASAINFSTEEMMEAIDYAHLHGKKIYLTINTLLKEHEIQNMLFRYLKPLYETGLDAVIVQDFGVLKFVKNNFPDLQIHASTQMNTCGKYFAKKLKELGVSRIVTARELSLDEIKEIYQETGLEIESFVHGALCYSYSGQCLLSSMIGGRSGNRGRCAQPCRLEYDVLDKNSLLNRTNNRYAISPKDLCTLDILPEILESGVHSLKIEGRMKKPEYVAGVTSVYRKYVDLYLEKGKKGYKVSKEDVRILKELYNRGGFTKGYYMQHNGKDMMAQDKPNHCGVVVGEISKINGTQIGIKLSEPLQKGDVLQFALKRQIADYTIGEPKEKGAYLTIRNRFQNGLVIQEQQLSTREIVRIRNNQLISDITGQYIDYQPQIPVIGQVWLEKNKPVRLELDYKNVHVCQQGAMVDEAQKRPVTEADVLKQLNKTGESTYYFEQLTVHCEENIFIPLKELNELRRTAFSAMTTQVLDQYRRVAKAEQNNREVDVAVGDKNVVPTYAALISKPEQWEALSGNKMIQRLYLETALLKENDIAYIAKEATEDGKEVCFALPYIFRKSAYDKIEKQLQSWSNLPCSGFLVRNPESYFFMLEHGFENYQYMFDSNIYNTNSYASECLNKWKYQGMTYSNELNLSELQQIPVTHSELDVYGYIPVMFTANCIRKNYSKCDANGIFDQYSLRDRTKSDLKVATVCSYCYNVIYYSQPKCLFDEWDDIQTISPQVIRFSFVFETKDEVAAVLRSFEKKQAMKTSEYTKGHFKRGVQ